MSVPSESDGELGTRLGVGPLKSALNGTRERTPPVLRAVRLDGLLSFAPGSEPLELRPLNVLVGPNSSGKTNLVEALRLLSVTPTHLDAFLRQSGGPDAWIWRGKPRADSAMIDMVVDPGTPARRPFRYRMEFAAPGSDTLLVREAIEGLSPHDPVASNLRGDRSLLTEGTDSVPDPEIAWLRGTVGDSWFAREWTFGPRAPVRHAQPTEFPDDKLLPDSSNLALVLHRIEQADDTLASGLLTRFFPRFERLSTRVSRGCVELFLHEPGFRNPIPAVRLSDGTLRFVALLAALHSPTPPRLLCIENPELGLHPDAVALLADLLVEASHRMQLLITTHSDTLVSALNDQPEAIVVCERPGAATELRRLDPEKLHIWLDEYSLGDLWRIGELGANP